MFGRVAHTGRLIVALAVLGGVLALACGLAAGPTQQPMKVRIGYQKTTTAPFVLIAKNQGSFQKAGVQVEWIDLAPPPVMEAIAAGSIDGGLIAGPIFFTAFDKGVDARLVLHLAGWSDPPSTFFARVDSGINSVQDLRGKKVGIHSYGGNFDLYLRHMLEQNGLDPKADVQILEVPIPAIYGALDTQRIDLGVVSPELVSTAEESFPGKFKPIFTFRDIPGVGDRPQTNNIMLAMSNNFLKNNRAAAKAFIKVVLDTQAWGFSNPQEALRIWAEEAGFPGMLKLRDAFGPDTRGKMDLPTLELQINLMNRYGYLKKQLAVKDVLDESLVDEINAGR
jgi:sulfonate transport system substrate-binding protein